MYKKECNVLIDKSGEGINNRGYGCAIYYCVVVSSLTGRSKRYLLGPVHYGK